MSRPFLKMNGLGNDFVVVEARSAPFEPSAAAVRAIADRTSGVGCDQLIVIEPGEGVDARVRFWNSDGEEIAACGNGTRCVGWLLMQASGKDHAVMESRAGMLVASRAGERLVSVDMGKPGLDWTDIPLASEKGGVGIHLAEHALALLLSLTRGLHTAIRQPDYALREPIRLEQRELYEMLGRSDVVVIALPLTKATRHLFTRDLFRRMRPTGILVNVTRGEIIFGDDLLAALDERLLWGAGLDVTDPEPLPKGHRLWTHPRVIVTPHTAGGSPRRAGRVIETFIENLRRLRTGEPLLALIDKEKGY